MLPLNPQPQSDMLLAGMTAQPMPDPMMGAADGGMGMDMMMQLQMLMGLQDPLQLALQSRGQGVQPMSPLAQQLTAQATNYGQAAMDPQQLNQLMMMVGQIGQGGGMPGMMPGVAPGMGGGQMGGAPMGGGGY